MIFFHSFPSNKDFNNDENYDKSKEEKLNEWISESHPTVETEIIEVLRARVQYAILDELNYMVSNQIGTPDEVKKIVLDEITEITNDSIELDTEEN